MSFILSISIRALAKNSSFGFFSVGFRVGKNQMCCLCGGLFVCCPTGLGLAKVAIYSTNFYSKHQIQIYKKLSYEVLQRHFSQTHVITSGFVLQ